MAYKYSNQKYSDEHMARASGRSLPISTKASIEICNMLRGAGLIRAKVILQDAISMQKPIEFKRFRNGAGHKKGIASGKFPVKAATEILKLLDNIEANAQFKGLNTSNLIINHILAQKGGNVWRYGRVRRRKMKRTNIEIVVEEKADSKKKETSSKKDIKNIAKEEKPKEGEGKVKDPKEELPVKKETKPSVPEKKATKPSPEKPKSEENPEKKSKKPDEKK